MLARGAAIVQKSSSTPSKQPLTQMAPQHSVGRRRVPPKLWVITTGRWVVTAGCEGQCALQSNGVCVRNPEQRPAAIAGVQLNTAAVPPRAPRDGRRRDDAGAAETMRARRAVGCRVAVMQKEWERNGNACMHGQETGADRLVGWVGVGH